ncbi:glycosyltransferase family 2 protein [Desulfovibrio cuneatus]|uniref:glycosyltransferase family 2 protein n=1 Tax=Desulfovibrio cuneatus TaxID=159728 RepID=UPI00041E401E|nr:glycosyltransferase family 2 protein [Desulfovibrio cuneatus]
MDHSQEPPVLFTIIAATYNAATCLPQLLDCLASQTCKDFELVVQDGASKDATAAVVAQYKDKLPAISFVSEPDTGIYDAWNKALKRARGEWVLFLGADDKLAESTTLQHVKNALQQAQPAINFAAGAMKMLDASGMCHLHSVPNVHANPERLEYIMPAAFSSLFQRRRIFAGQGFNPNYRIAADYDWLCRVWKNDEAIDLDILVTIMNEGGVSSLPQNRLRVELECARVSSSYFPHVWKKERIMKLGKAALVSTCFTVFSSRVAAKLLDSIRKLRGLPPVWFR